MSHESSDNSPDGNVDNLDHLDNMDNVDRVDHLANVDNVDSPGNVDRVNHIDPVNHIDHIDPADLYLRLFRQMPDGFALRQLIYDHLGEPCDFRFVDVNQAFSCFSGMPREAMVGYLDSEIRKNGKPPKPHLDIFSRVVQTGIPERLEYYVPETDSYFHLHVFPVQGNLFATQTHEMTEHRRAEEDLRRREQLFRLMTEHALDAVYKLKVKPEIRLEYVSPAATRVIGYSPDELCNMSCAQLALLVHEEDVKNMMAAIAPEMAKPGIVCLRVLKKDGSVVWLEQSITPVTDDLGNLVGIEAIARDISERKQMEDTLKFLSLHDSLTGLYNRAFFEEEMRRLDGGRDYPITILSTDVDGLKMINDTFGHRGGDDLLKTYAAVLKSTFRKADIVARVGGDEFAIILPRTDGALADGFAARLQQALGQHNRESSALFLSVSCGAATTRDSGMTLPEVFNRADRMMYMKKSERSGQARTNPRYFES